MLVAILMAAQVIPAAPPPLPAAGPDVPEALTVVSRCADSSNDIVVCGQKDPDQYRLRPLGPPPGGRPLPPMTAKLGNGMVDLKAVQRSLPGASAPAAMVTIKLPF